MHRKTVCTIRQGAKYLITSKNTTRHVNARKTKKDSDRYLCTFEGNGCYLHFLVRGKRNYHESGMFIYEIGKAFEMQIWLAAYLRNDKWV
jgi:hypothetical protein